MIVALVGVGPANAQDDPLPPAGDGGPPPAGAGELFQGGPGAPPQPVPNPDVDIVYPPKWDPALHTDIARFDYLITYASINTTTGDVYDPISNEVILADGTVLDHRTGEVVFSDPLLADPPTPSEFNTLVAQGMFPFYGTLDGTDEGLALWLSGVIQPEQTDPDLPSAGDAETDDGFMTPEERAAQPHPMESNDEVLQHYRLGTPLSELGEFAFPTGDLPREAIEEALQFASYEIALLFHLNAFDQATPWYATFEQIYLEFDIDSAVPRANLLATLQTVDVQMQSRSALFGRVTTIEDEYVTWAIKTMPDGFRSDLLNGRTGFINGFEYAAGLLRLMATADAAGGFSTAVDAAAAAGDTGEFTLQVALEGALDSLAIADDLNRLLLLEVEELQNAVALLANPVVDAIAPVADEIADDGGDLLLYSAIAALAGLLVVGAVFFLLRQRRTDRRGPDPVLFDGDAATATIQLLAGARDEGEIVRILDRASESHVGHRTVLFHVVNDGLQPLGSTTILTGSDLTRVVTSGQRAMTVLRDDPAFPGETRAVMAIPVIHGGRVQAVLASHRLGDATFTSTDMARLEPIAPALGGALETASELGTLTKLAMVDGLTSLGNRRRLDGDLETTLASAVAGDAPLGFAMVDVDHFKTYNDTHGHTAGDEVLRKVAATIARCVRDSDVVYRYGGEEFSILFPGATAEEAAQVAERVRATVEAEHFPGEERQPGGSLTISVGVATLATGPADDIRERADQALYQAKHGGRNRVAFA
ncbi:MAG: GGDEF domain-containing protein [Actinomycetota bacterium]